MVSGAGGAFPTFLRSRKCTSTVAVVMWKTEPNPPCGGVFSKDCGQPSRITRTVGGCPQSGSRVAPGDYSPGAPTDPDVRISRIRLVETEVRYVPYR